MIVLAEQPDLEYFFPLCLQRNSSRLLEMQGVSTVPWDTPPAIPSVGLVCPIRSIRAIAIVDMSLCHPKFIAKSHLQTLQLKRVVDDALNQKDARRTRHIKPRILAFPGNEQSGL